VETFKTKPFDNQHVSKSTTKEPARTAISVIAIPPMALKRLLTSLFSSQILGWNRFLSLGPEDCEFLVDPEVFGWRGVEVGTEYVLSSGLEDCELSVDPEIFGRGGVEVESEYVLSLAPGDCELSVDPEAFGRGGVEVESEYVLSSGLEDCELSVDPEVFGRGGVGVESEYDLELRISGRPGMVLTALRTVRW
jgi:hypothetical protein